MPDSIVAESAVAARRLRACRALMRKVHAITAAEGTGAAALEKVKAALVALAAKGEALFPRADFALPEAQGRTHTLLVEPDDGYGLYLTVFLPGKEAAAHDHGIWCVNAGIHGSELHRFFRRTDDGTREGFAEIEEISRHEVRPGTGMAMQDHAIHATEVLGEEPAYALALYGYALARFPSVVWYHPEFSSVRAMPSRRAA